jgi:hypothetical protein
VAHGHEHVFVAANADTLYTTVYLVFGKVYVDYM